MGPRGPQRLASRGSGESAIAGARLSLTGLNCCSVRMSHRAPFMRGKKPPCGSGKHQMDYALHVLVSLSHAGVVE